VRKREQGCIRGLLELHRFRPEDCEAEGLAMSDGKWGLDLFSPAAMKQFGVSAGGAAAAGAMVGLTLDVALGGLSLGTGTAIGAAVGALIGAGRTHGRRLVELVRGHTELRCDDATLRLLEARQMTLVRALLRRGHASQDRMRLDAKSDEINPVQATSLSETLREARSRPRWSRLRERDGDGQPHALLAPVFDPARDAAIDQLARELEGRIRKLGPART
jgi:hypothetical protein